MTYPEYNTLQVEVKDQIATVRLNRPGNLNAFNPELHHEFEDVWLRVADDPDVRAAVLTGGGKAFSAGGDMRATAERNKNPVARFNQAKNTRREAYNALCRLLDVPQPVIAAINGDAIGLGATLALACDTAVMSETARIGDPHVRVGLVAGDGGAVIWPLLIGPNRAKDFLMRGRLVKGAEALQMGLVSAVAPSESVLETAMEIARELTQLPPLAVQWTKLSVNKGIKHQLELIFDASIGFESLAMMSEDHAEAVSAFLEKRTPVYKGR